jgi:hypothetical protein
MPTSITTQPGFNIAPVIASALPIAATTISACFVYWAMSLVPVWAMAIDIREMRLSVKILLAKKFSLVSIVADVKDVSSRNSFPLLTFLVRRGLGGGALYSPEEFLSLLRSSK